jgi:general secretion pathway protein N
MNPNMLRWRGLLWWVIPFAALALLLGIETDWGRAIRRLPGPAPTIEPKPVVAALLPEYRVEGGLAAHQETVSRTLFNPTRRPAPPALSDASRSSMQKGKFLLTGTAVAGDRHIAFLKEVAGGKSRVVRQGEQINGALVALVAADRVKLTQGDDSEELILKAVPGPKTTTPPAPQAPPTVVPPSGVATLPGAVPPVTPAAAEGIPVPAPTSAPTAVRRPNAAMPVPLVPGTTPLPAPAPAPAPAAPAADQGTAASPNPAWNDVFEAMKQRNKAPAD